MAGTHVDELIRSAEKLNREHAQLSGDLQRKAAELQAEIESLSKPAARKKRADEMRAKLFLADWMVAAVPNFGDWLQRNADNCISSASERDRDAVAALVKSICDR